MTKIAYEKRNFAPNTLTVIDSANQIIAEYMAGGFRLTLRQLYYQFVARRLIENTMRAYKRLGGIVNDGRRAGLIDWEAIEDRTRALRANPHWDDPGEIVEAAATSFRLDKWIDQEYRPEVWIEKDALEGVIAGVCRNLDVDHFACRGYVSQSEMWKAAMRLRARASEAQTPIILYLGDHDPSGIDMTRDIVDRLRLFMGGLEVRRLALNMDQVEALQPPPNPAKVTDTRYAGYRKLYGPESWELDALNPKILADLVESAVLNLRDREAWQQQEALERQGRRQLRAMADAWRES